MQIFRLTTILTLLTFASNAQTPPVWTRKQPATSPAARSGPSLAYDAARSQTVLFGGLDDVNLLSFGDTWAWDGTNWTRKTPQTTPGARFGQNMVYDAARGQVVLFGGTIIFPDGSIADVNDTYVWDGSNWIRKTPQTSPPARRFPSMAYDAVTGRVILFGGIVGNSTGNCFAPLSDTWAWDGTNWTKLAPATSPTARFEAAMSDDSARGQIVLFGGAVTQCLGQAPNTVNDTWVWDGSNWIQKTVPVSPSSRYLHAMSNDAAGSQVLLFGGANSRPLLAPLGDTWAWDGSKWTQIATTGPVARYEHAMAYDAARSQTLLFGGITVNALIPDFADTWTLDSPPGSGQPAVTTVISAGAFGAFNAVAPGSWVEIYGSNLAKTTRLWNGTDFTGVNAPTSLDGVQVTVGGQKAFIDYVSSSPAQINVQVPSNVTTGAQQLIVTNGGVSSAPFNVTVNATQPGLLAPDSFQVGGKQYVVAQALDGTYILPTGAIPGVNSRPAKVGETISIYGIGFGPVTPNQPAGQIVMQDTQISAGMQMKFGSTAATTSYSGLAKQYLGLYLFNVTVPPVSPNNLLPLSFTLGGTPGAQVLYTAVQ